MGGVHGIPRQIAGFDGIVSQCLVCAYVPAGLYRYAQLAHPDISRRAKALCSIDDIIASTSLFSFACLGRAAENPSSVSNHLKVVSRQNSSFGNISDQKHGQLVD